MNAKPNKIQIRLEQAFKKRSKKLTQEEIDIIADVGILENAVGGLMHISMRNYALACATVLQKAYNWKVEEAERFIKLSAVKFAKFMDMNIDEQA